MEHIKSLVNPASIDWEMLRETTEKFMQDAFERMDEHMDDDIRNFEEILELVKNKDIDKIVQKFGNHTPDFLYSDYQSYFQQHRISDINIYSGRGGGYFIRCKVDGQQQMGRQMTALDVACFQDDKDRDALAARYFKDVLLAEGQQQAKGMKR